jgi:hypothetical protein
VDTSPHLITIARLNGAAQRLAGWTPPTGPARQTAIAELRAIAGDDTEAYAHAAGTMLGAHPPGDAAHGIHTNAAHLILDAGQLTADDDRVQRWITVGAERRERRIAELRAGDHWDRSGI